MISLLNLGQYIFSFVLMISIIVFIHEFGHYIVAKLAKVKIEVFSIGFGPEIFGWNDRSGTRWRVSSIPMGGYVKMYGDASAASNPDEKKIENLTEEQQKLTFHKKPLWIKSLIVAAGPLANFILAIFILAIFFCHYGKPYSTTEITAVAKNSAAEVAGLQAGDIIISIDGKKVKAFSDIESIISMNPQTKLSLVLKRQHEMLEKVVVPRLIVHEDIFGNKVKISRLGISSNIVEYKKYNIIEGINEASRETWRISALNLKAIGQMLIGKRGTDELGGPIKIVKYSGQSFKKGINVFFWFMAMLSINLALINLFPVPVLDGGHLLYYFIEAVRGRPLADKFQQFGMRIGMALIIMLTIFSTFNDIKGFFNKDSKTSSIDRHNNDEKNN